MKLTKQQLRTMIREEVSRTVLNEDVYGEDALINLLKRNKSPNQFPRQKRIPYFYTFMAMFIENEQDYDYFLRLLRGDDTKKDILSRLDPDADAEE